MKDIPILSDSAVGITYTLPSEFSGIEAWYSDLVNVKEDATSSRVEGWRSDSDKPTTDSLEDDFDDEDEEARYDKYGFDKDDEEWNLSEFFLSKLFENLILDVEGINKETIYIKHNHSKYLL